jgi:hypothetical protein
MPISPHDRPTARVPHQQSPLHCSQVRGPHLGHRAALALQALGICERLLAHKRGGVRLAEGHTLRESPTLGHAGSADHVPDIIDNGQSNELVQLACRLGSHRCHGP